MATNSQEANSFTLNEEPTLPELSMWSAVRAGFPRPVPAPGGQQLLFPSSADQALQLAGIDGVRARELNKWGLLSFPPSNQPLDEAQELELEFVSTLLRAGCDDQMLRRLLSGLAAPYAYDIHGMYYDWGTRAWHTLPEKAGGAEAAFSDWLDQLAGDRDAESLRGIVELATEALSRVYSIH